MIFQQINRHKVTKDHPIQNHVENILVASDTYPLNLRKLESGLEFRIL